MPKIKTILTIAFGMSFILPAQAQLNNITVFATPDFVSNNYDTSAYQFGKLLGQQNKTLVYTGAATGTMGAVLKGATEAKATIIGISTPELYEKQCPEKHPCRQQEIKFVDTPSTQLQYLLETGDAIVILPGSWDMMNAFTTYAVQVQNGEQKKKPIIFLNINHYWDNLRYQLDEMTRQKIIDENQTDYIAFIDKPRDVLKEIPKLNRQIEKNKARGITNTLTLPTNKGTITVHYR